MEWLKVEPSRESPGGYPHLVSGNFKISATYRDGKFVWMLNRKNPLRIDGYDRIGPFESQQEAKQVAEKMACEPTKST